MLNENLYYIIYHDFGNDKKHYNYIKVYLLYDKNWLLYKIEKFKIIKFYLKIWLL